MIRKLFTAFLILCSNLLFAQYIQFNWQTCFNNPLYDNASDIVATGDGYLLVGSSLLSEPIPPDFYDNDIWLIKIGMDGEFIWQKMLGGSDSDEPAQIVPSSDGNYFIIAVSTSSVVILQQILILLVQITGLLKLIAKEI